MLRWAPALGGLVLVVGCSREPPSLEDGSSDGSSGGASSSSSGASSSSSGASSGGDSTSGSSSGDPSATGFDDTSTGTTASGRARFVVQEPHGTGEHAELVLYAYADGELSPPHPLTPELAELGGGAQVSSVSAAGTSLSYSVFDPSLTRSSYFALDLTTDPPGAAQPFEAGPVSATDDLHDVIWVEATETFVFQATGHAEPHPRAIYSAAFTGGTLATPMLVAAIEPGPQAIAYEVDREGARLGYTTGPEGGPLDGFVAALDPPDPDEVTRVSELVAPDGVSGAPQLVPRREAVVYSTNDDASSTEEAIYFVDLSGPVPGTPIRVDDSLDAVPDVDGVAIAPDGHALIYWTGISPFGDLMLVELSEAGPQPPVPVSQPMDFQTSRDHFGWSPDSRWIVYLAAHEQPFTADIHLVDATGDAPGEPWLATGGLVPSGGVYELFFDPQSHWLYYVARQNGNEYELYRVDVSGSEPGPPQRVSGPPPAGSSITELVPSHDGSKLLYVVTINGEPRVRDLYLVDVAGPEPGDATRVHAPLAAGVEVGSRPRFSLDGSVVLHRESGPTGDDLRPLRLVDLTDGSVLTVTDDALDVHPVAD